MSLAFYHFPEKFKTESGYDFKGLRLAYTVHGTLNQQRDNVIWVFHALTANSDPAEWWPGMLGSDLLFDPQKHYIICVNMPGSCYGSSGPLDENVKTGQLWYHDFPLFSIRDMVNAYRQLRDHLGIRSVMLGIGGSMGGMQALEWAVQEPDFFKSLVLIACSARHSAWGIAFNASQRMALESDITWQERHAQAGAEGMKVARSMALLSYRCFEAYEATQTDRSDKLQHYKAESYQRYQGEKFAGRFNAFSYYRLSQSMDTHHVGRNRESTESALHRVTAETLIISIQGDQLFPLNDQIFLAENIPGARLEIIPSVYGHDGFLIEVKALSKKIRQHLLQKTQ